MANVANIIISLQARQEQLEAALARSREDLAKTRSTVTRLQDQFKSSSAAIGSSLKRLETSIGGVSQAASFLSSRFRLFFGIATTFLTGSLVSRTFDFADNLNNLANRLNINVENLQGLQNVIRITGGDVGAFSNIVQRLAANFNEAQGSNTQLRNAFSDLGIDVVKLKGLKTDELLFRIADSIKAIQDPSLASAKLLALGVRGAGQFFNTFRLGSDTLKDFIKDQKEIGAILDESVIKKGAAANEQLTLLKQVITTQVQAALIQLSPFLISLSNHIIRIVAGLINTNTEFEKLTQDEKSIVRTLQSIGNAVGIVATGFVNFVNALDRFRIQQLQEDIKATAKALNEINTELNKRKEGNDRSGILGTLDALFEGRGQFAGIRTDFLESEKTRLLAKIDELRKEVTARIGNKSIDVEIPLRARIKEVFDSFEQQPSILDSVVGTSRDSEVATEQEVKAVLTKLRGVFDKSLNEINEKVKADALKIIQSSELPIETLLRKTRELENLQIAFPDIIDTTAFDNAIEKIQEDYEKSLSRIDSSTEKLRQVTAEKFRDIQNRVAESIESQKQSILTFIETPLEGYRKKLQEIKDLEALDAITPEQAARAVKRLNIELFQTSTTGRLLETVGQQFGTTLNTILEGLVTRTISLNDALKDLGRTLLLTLGSAFIRQGTSSVTSALFNSFASGSTAATSSGAIDASLGTTVTAQFGGLFTRPTMVLAGENPSTRPEMILNRQQLSTLLNQDTGSRSGISIINVSSPEEAEQQRRTREAVGDQVIINTIRREFLRGESTLTRSARIAINNRR